jgi:uncharacterized protein YjbI with pentapeptide repeats
MSQFKLFDYLNKKNLVIIILILLTLIFILIEHNREVFQSYLDKSLTSTTIRKNVISVAKKAVPIKNFILMRNTNDKIALLKSSGSCVFCNLSEGNLEGINLKGVDLRYSVLTSANLIDANLVGANLSNTNLVGANLSNANLVGVNFLNANLVRINLSKQNLTGINLTGAILTDANLSGAILDGVNLTNKDLTGVNLSDVNLEQKDLAGAILTNANLSGANLSRVDLRGTKLSGVNLTGVNFSYTNLDGVDFKNKDLTEVDFSGVNFRQKDLTGAILIGANLSGANLSRIDLRDLNLTGAILTGANLSGSNLDGVDLANKDLTGVNLSGVDLRSTNLNGAILTGANLSDSILDGVDLTNKDLTGVNLSGVDLNSINLSGATLKDAKQIEINIRKTKSSYWPSINELHNLNVTRYELNNDIQYIATKEGFLFESKNNNSKLVLDLNKDALFPFTDYEYNGGLLGIASNDEFVYISYSSKGPNFDSEIGVDGNSIEIKEFTSLIVDEYSLDFKTSRNIIKIDGYLPTHYGGALVFDKKGNLYLSAGDGGPHPDYNNQAQDLQDLRGKIMRLDVSKSKNEPEIIAYGLRNPFGVSIDSKDRMFIVTCGHGGPVAVYLLNDLNPIVPSNLGWPYFEGTQRTFFDFYQQKRPEMISNVLSPIYENNIKPGCLTAGVYLDDKELFLLGDFYGTIRLLKEQKNGSWSSYYSDKLENGTIWGFGLDKKTKKIFIAPKSLELEIEENLIKTSK